MILSSHCGMSGFNLNYILTIP